MENCINTLWYFRGYETVREEIEAVTNQSFK